jgi:hypothetical protein
MALEAVQRIDALFDIERSINGQPAEQRLTIRQERSAGSNRGGERAALLYTLIVTAKLNDIDPQAWLADVLARIAEHPANRLDELLPWNWASQRAIANAA